MSFLKLQIDYLPIFQARQNTLCLIKADICQLSKGVFFYQVMVRGITSNLTSPFSRGWILE